MNEMNKNEAIRSLKIEKKKRYDSKPKSKKIFYLLYFVIFITICIAYFVFKGNLEPATKVNVTTVTLMTGNNSQAALVASGYVVAQRKAEVASKGTGRLKYLGFEEGDTVLTGQVIAEIENEDIKANVALADANVQKAAVDTLNASRNYKRQKSLFASGSITETILEDAEIAYKSSLALLSAAEASKTAAEVELENTFIRAPFSGTVLTKNADVGEIVAPFASSATSKGSVVTLADMNSLEVEADVSESNIYKVEVGQKCTIVLDAYPDHDYNGYVKKIVPTADRSRATVLTKIAFTDKNDRVLPEMSARVNFFTEEPKQDSEYKNVVVVDKDVVTERNGKKVAFKIIGELTEMVSLSLGRELGEVIEIKNGLNPGDKVILSPPGKMLDKEKVEISK